MALVKVKNASFCYGRHEVFDRLSFSVGKGEIFCLLGPNGCGKTTLLDCILGALKLKDGGIFINGKPISQFKRGPLAREMAYVPQRHEQTFPYRVVEVVVMVRAALLHQGNFLTVGNADEVICEEEMKRLYRVNVGVVSCRIEGNGEFRQVVPVNAV